MINPIGKKIQLYYLLSFRGFAVKETETNLANPGAGGEFV
jgi:hypothetical protein